MVLPILITHRSGNQGLEVGMDTFITILMTCLRNSLCFLYPQICISGFRGLGPTGEMFLRGETANVLFKFKLQLAAAWVF